jgi:predicted N-formylglutamate amidohydrolase
MPEVSDGTPVPGNRGLDREEIRRRIRGSFLPYHRTIARRLAAFRRAGRVPAVIGVHSCTPVLGGVARPWQVGVLWNRDGRLALPVLEALRLDPDLVVGDNQPYSGRSGIGYSVAFHAERAGLPHLQFEVRQDLFDTPDKARPWARRLALALRGPLADPNLYRIHRF